MLNKYPNTFTYFSYIFFYCTDDIMIKIRLYYYEDMDHSVLHHRSRYYMYACGYN